MPEVVCFGELLVDMVSEQTDVSLGTAPGFIKAPGGAPANVAVGLSRLGTDSSFVGQVGEDPFGHWLASIITAENVDSSHLKFSEQARTTVAFVATRSDGHKDVCFYRHPGADAQLHSSNLDFQMFDSARLFHCGGVSLSQSPCREAQFMAAREARKRGILVSYDPNWRPSLWQDHDAAREVLWQMLALSDIVKVADEEWQFLTGTTDLARGAEWIRSLGSKLVVVTLGSKGAYFNSQKGEGKVDGFATSSRCTLGAGDSFMAGLIHQVLSYSLTDDFLLPEQQFLALRFANACGALATRTSGAIPSLPTYEEVLRFMNYRSLRCLTDSSDSCLRYL